MSTRTLAGTSIEKVSGRSRESFHHRELVSPDSIRTSGRSSASATAHSRLSCSFHARETRATLTEANTASWVAAIQGYRRGRGGGSRSSRSSKPLRAIPAAVGHSIAD